LGCQLQNAPYNLTATVNYAGNDTLVELNWQYNSSNPNELFIVEMYVAEYFVWDIRNDSCLLGPFPTTNHMFVTGTTYTDKLTSITKYKIPYRVFAVDTTNQLMSCHSTIVVVDLLNSVEEKKEKSFLSIYPNPNNGIFNIALPTVQDEVQVTIYNLSGQQIKNLTLKDKGIIDISKQPNGIYFVKVIHQHQVITLKIIKY